MNRLIIVLAMLIVSITFISAQPKDNDFSRMGKRDKLLKVLKLTPEQKKQFEDITSENSKYIIDIRAKIQKNQIDLNKMLNEKQIDEQKILQLVDEDSKLQSDIKHSIATRLLSIYKILDDKQKEMFTKAVSHMLNSGFMGEGMRPHMGPGMRNWEHKEKEESK